MNAIEKAPSISCKMIVCLLPADGSDKKLMHALYEQKHINHTASNSCMGAAILAKAKTKYGELPEPKLIRKITILVEEERADEIFDFIYTFAELDKGPRGVVWLTPSMQVSPYSMPEGMELDAED